MSNAEHSDAAPVVKVEGADPPGANVPSPQLAVPGLQKAINWYLAGFCFLGFVIGGFTGLSSSLIVTTVLPLLFALIGGTGGLYLATADFNSQFVPMRLLALGKALLLFSALLAAGSITGIMLRVSYKAPPRPVDFAIESESSSDFIELLLLKQKLSFLGATVTEQETALRKASQDIKEWNAPVPAQKLQYLVDRLEAGLGQCDKVVTNAIAKGETPPGELPRMISSLRDFRLDVSLSLVPTNSNKGMPKERYLASVTRVLYAVARLSRGNGDEYRWLLAHGFDPNSIAEMYEVLDSDINLREGPDWKSGHVLAKQIDEFLVSLHSGKLGKREELLPDADLGQSSSKEKTSEKTNSNVSPKE